MIVNLMKEDFQICIEWKCAVFTRSINKNFGILILKKYFCFIYKKLQSHQYFIFTLNVSFNSRFKRKFGLKIYDSILVRCFKSNSFEPLVPSVLYIGRQTIILISI